MHDSLVQAGRPENRFFFWSTLVTRLLTPRSRKSGYGLLLGCRSGWDFGPFEKTFFWQSSNAQKLGKSSVFTLCFGPKSQSIGRGRISREGALDHRESRERRDKIFAAQTVKRQKNQKKKWIRKTVFSGEFSFFGRGKTNFGGGGITSKLAGQWPSWGIYKHAPPGFWRKRRLLYWKKGGQIKSFSWPGELVQVDTFRQVMWRV